jgi:polyhydroxybutyrate depolymerase
MSVSIVFRVFPLTYIAVAISILATCGSRSARDASSSAALGPGTFERSFKVGDQQRTYRIHIPPSFSAGKPLSLVLAFHGHYGTGDVMARMTHFDVVSDRNGFVVVYPDGIGRSWNTGAGNGKAEQSQIDDVGFISTLIDQLGHEFPIDRQRVYATGISMGGIFTQRLGCELSTKLAAIAPVAGNMATSIASTCHPKNPVSVMQIHGADDRLTPWEGGETAGGGRIISVPATIQLWVERNKCPSAPERETAAQGVTCNRSAPCQSNAAVTLCRVEAGGHTWPKGDQILPSIVVGEANNSFDASEAIWQFFSQHALSHQNLTQALSDSFSPAGGDRYEKHSAD